jgi:sterol desaturase/sphingolipid hydroxylase (fatty acid hydroxylase superfamily)
MVDEPVTDAGRARWFDWLTWPALAGGALVMTAALLPRLDPALVTVMVSVAVAGVLLGLQRVRPQQARARRRESVWGELGHVLAGAELGTIVGYGLGVAIGEVIARAWGTASPWPTGGPLIAHVAVGLLVADAASYWQHRAVHRVGFLWRFHALHHQPRRLDVIKAGRFHAVDFATATAAAYLPLAALGAPTAVLAWVAIVNSVFGLLQHADVRMPTARWLDALLCTPAAHWRHHGRATGDDGNYATVCMLVDRAFGTWVDTGGRRPVALGLADDPLPRGWLARIVAPFRASPPPPARPALARDERARE